MQFRFTEEQQMIRDAAQGAVARLSQASPVLDVISSGETMNQAAWATLASELGLAGVGISETYQGSGLGAVEQACVAEAIGTHLLPVPNMASAVLAAGVLEYGGTPDQKAHWLPQMSDGGLVATWAHRARGNQTNSLRIDAGGRLAGKASHVLHGAQAGLLVLSALDPSGAERLVLLEPGTDGLSITPRTCLDLTQPVADIACDGIPVPGEAQACPSRADIDRALDRARIALAGEQLGAAQAALELTVAYVQDRVQFGRKIGSFQAVKHRLADRACDLESARSAVYYGACAFDEDLAERSEAAAIAAWTASETFKACARDMIQFHGGIGFTWEHVAHLYFKRAWSAAEMLGGARRNLETIADSLVRETDA